MYTPNEFEVKIVPMARNKLPIILKIVYKANL